ncbi:MAG: 4Fe-4S binding protein [Desulfobacterales bacterium]|nr:4Fe-4S binding protein [Desulfobacterales bacterium]
MPYQITEQCVACRECIDACTEKSIREEGRNDGFSPVPTYRIDADACTDCGQCADICPVDAIEYMAG